MSAAKKNKRFATVGLLAGLYLLLLTVTGCSPVKELLIQGDSLAKEGKYSEALVAYAEADSHESDSVLGLCRAGNLQLRQKRPGPALQAFEQALEKLPESPEAYLGVAKVYLFKGIDATAIQALERVMKLDPQNPELILNDLRKVLSRAEMDPRELRMLRGIFHRMDLWIAGHGGPATPNQPRGKKK